MKYIHQIDFRTLIVASRSYGKCAAGVPGTITRLSYRSDNPAVGSCTFDVLLNGTSIYGSPSDRPVIPNGGTHVTIELLSALALAPAVSEMDTLEFTAVLAGGSIGNTLYSQLTIERDEGSIVFDDGDSSTTGGVFIFDEGSI